MKTILSKIIPVLFSLVLCLSYLPATNGQAAKKKTITTTLKLENNTKSITVTAKNIHKNLSNGKSVRLKVKGKNSQKKVHKLLAKARTAVGKENKQSIGFQPVMEKTKSGYTYYRLTDPKTYKYMVKFVKKLYSLTRNMLLKQETNIKFYEDYKKYNNLETLQMHILYDELCDKYRYTDEYRKLIGFQEPTTNISIYVTRSSMDSPKLTKLTKEEEKDLIIKSEGTFEDSVYEGIQNYVEFNTFEEFKEKVKKYPKALQAIAVSSKFGEFKKYHYLSMQLLFPEELIPTILIMETENFCDLPQATQLYAIEKSYYFSCQHKGTSYSKNLARVQGLKKAYCMYYDKTTKPVIGEWKIARALYQGKAAGVCTNYAFNEQFLFNLLGFDSRICTKREINHAYTVLKIKNSKGKTLWVPFDYKIGPSATLVVTKKIREKYLKTEKMRYKLYLSGVKGAPKKKNFTIADFI